MSSLVIVAALVFERSRRNTDKHTETKALPLRLQLVLKVTKCIGNLLLR